MCCDTALLWAFLFHGLLWDGKLVVGAWWSIEYLELTTLLNLFLMWGIFCLVRFMLFGSGDHKFRHKWKLFYWRFEDTSGDPFYTSLKWWTILYWNCLKLHLIYTDFVYLVCIYICVCALLYSYYEIIAPPKVCISVLLQTLVWILLNMHIKFEFLYTLNFL